MVKGCKRQMIHLRNTGSEWFEEAYFLVSEQAEADGCDFRALMKEADRIVSENGFASGKQPASGGLRAFLVGAAGALCILGTWFLLSLL